MAYLNICGAETGDGAETYNGSLAAGVTVTGTNKRTGSYCYRTNATGSGVAAQPFRGLSSTGVAANWAAATVYSTLHLRVETLPSADEEECYAIFSDDTGADFSVTLRLTSAGIVKLYKGDLFGTQSLVATGTTSLSTGSYYRIDFKMGTGGSAAYELKINGAAEFSGTTALSTATTWLYCQIGKTINRNGRSVDYYWDDLAWRDDDWVGAGEVRAIRPNGAGTESTGWASGTGSTYAEVDEVTPDGDSTYLKSIAAGDVRNFTLEDSSTAGITGTVGVVKFCAITRNEGGAPSGHVRWGKTSISASTSTSTAAFPASYGLIAGISSTWTTTADVDALILGVAQVGTSLAARCTALYAMVWSTGQINTTVTPGAASLTLTAYTPSSVVGTKLTPGALSLTTTRYTPTVLTPVVGTPGALALTMTPYAPSVTIGLTVTPGALALALTAYTPTVINPQSATPGAASLTLTPYAPGAVVNNIVTPGAGALALTAYGLLAAFATIVTPGAGAMGLTAYAPGALLNNIATPGALSAALTGYAPSVLTPVVVTPATLSAVLTAHAPGAPIGTKVTPGALSAALTAYGLAVNIGWQLTPGPASLAVMTYGLSWTLSGFPNPDRRLYGAGRFAAGGYGSGRFGSINRGTGRSDQPGRGAGR